MNMQQMLGEAGRTMSTPMRDTLVPQPEQPQQMPQTMLMSDNEPRMQERDQAFSIEADIQNLMKSYNMLVEAQDFDRAQQVATMIDQLQQQKIGIQAQQANAQIQTGYAGSQRPQPIQDDISRILDSISI